MWLKRGICGIDLKKQTGAIGTLYCLVCLAGMIFGFICIDSPETIVGQVSQVVQQETSDEESVAESSDVADAILNGTITFQDRIVRDEYIRSVQESGVRNVVASLVTMILSVILLIGVRQGKSVMLVPWIAEQCTAFCVAFVYLAIKGLGGYLQFSIGTCITVICWFTVTFFCTYAVISYFVMLRRMKRHSKDIISSVMNTAGYQSGFNYERMQEDLGREMQVVPPGRDRADEEKVRDDIMYFSI